MYLSSHVVRSLCHSNEIDNVLNESPANVNEGENLTNMLLMTGIGQLSVLDFSRDRKMMSVLCSRKQQEILFCKGAPESIFSRCTSVLCNDDGSAAPMTAEIRAELEERLIRCFSTSITFLNFLELDPVVL